MGSHKAWMDSDSLTSPSPASHTHTLTHTNSAPTPCVTSFCCGCQRGFTAEKERLTLFPLLFVTETSWLRRPTRLTDTEKTAQRIDICQKEWDQTFSLFLFFCSQQDLHEFWGCLQQVTLLFVLYFAWSLWAEGKCFRYPGTSVSFLLYIISAD